MVSPSDREEGSMESVASAAGVLYYGKGHKGLVPWAVFH